MVSEKEKEERLYEKDCKLLENLLMTKFNPNILSKKMKKKYKAFYDSVRKDKSNANKKGKIRELKLHLLTKFRKGGFLTEDVALKNYTKKVKKREIGSHRIKSYEGGEVCNIYEQNNIFRDNERSFAKQVMKKFGAKFEYKKGGYKQRSVHLNGEKVSSDPEWLIYFPEFKHVKIIEIKNQDVNGSTSKKLAYDVTILQTIYSRAFEKTGISFEYILILCGEEYAEGNNHQLDMIYKKARENKCILRFDDYDINELPLDKFKDPIKIQKNGKEKINEKDQKTLFFRK